VSALLPGLALLEGRRWVFAALALSAAVLCWPLAGGGAPELGAGLEGWDAVSRHGPGLALVQSGDAGFPAGTDVVARGGYPLAAVLCWPLLAALGLPAGLAVGTWLWLWAAGVAGAELGGRWWGSPLSGLVCGVGWQATWASGGPDRAAAAAFLALSLCAVVSALARPRWRAAGVAGAAATASGLCWAPAGAVCGAALVLALAVGLAGGKLHSVWVAGSGAVVGALGLSLPVWGWTLTYRWLVPPAPVEALRWPLVAALVCALLAARRARRSRRRWLLPVLLIVTGGALVGLTAGLGVMDPLRDIPRVDGSREMLALVSLGLVLLAGGVGRHGKWTAVAVSVLVVNGLVQAPMTARPWPVVPEVYGPVAVVPWAAGADPMVRAALGVPVVNPPSMEDPVWGWMLRRWPALEGPTSEAGKATLRELGVTAIVNVETGTVTDL